MTLSLDSHVGVCTLLEGMVDFEISPLLCVEYAFDVCSHFVQWCLLAETLHSRTNCIMFSILSDHCVSVCTFMHQTTILFVCIYM